jgi:predicted RNA binding protein YcfA (HicA-like mRNA interferase family)
VKPRELLTRIGRGDVRNVRFADLQRLLEALGFVEERIRGSHHTYRHPALRAKVNLQPLQGQAKPYQVRQVADLAARYSLSVEDDA